MNLGIGLGLTNYLRVPTVALDPDAAISELFRTGTPGVYYEGAWYDPSDSTTVFQDAAGTTPATVGDPVGLILDKSKGLTLGAELVTLSLPASYTNYTGYIVLGTSKVVGSWYKYQFTLSLVTSGGVSIHPERAGIYDSADGTYSYIINSTSTALRFYANNFTGTIDSITVKELPGNHATQSTSTARPTLQTSGGLYYLDFDGVDDFLRTATFALAQSQPNTVALGYKWDVIGASKFIHDGIGTERHAIFTLSGNLTAYAGASANAGAATTNDQVLVTHFNTTNSFMRVDGSDAVTAANVGTMTWTGITLGQVASTGGNGDARIYGYVGVNRTLTAGEIDDVEAYLAAKSGVTL